MLYQHILIAVDLTDECHPVVQRALDLAASSGARASLVHIIEPMAMAFGGDVPMDLHCCNSSNSTKPASAWKALPRSTRSWASTSATWLTASPARRSIAW